MRELLEKVESSGKVFIMAMIMDAVYSSRYSWLYPERR